MKRETMLINLTLIHWFHAWERKWKRERKRIEKPFVVLRCIEVNVVIKRVRGRGICGRSLISIRARQTSGRNVRVARVLCRKLHCWILNGAEKLGPPRTFSFLHNSRDWREGGGRGLHENSHHRIETMFISKIEYPAVRDGRIDDNRGVGL